MDTWVIYALVANVDLRIRYIGYSTMPRVRLLQHLSKARNGDGRRVHDWIRAKEAEGQNIQMLTLQTGTGDGWAAVERQWIAAFRGALLNISEGGGTPMIPVASRKRAGEKLKKRVFSDEHRARISEANRGRKRPDNADRNRAIAAVLKGRPLQISDTERTRRSEFAKGNGPRTKKVWAERTEAQRAEISQRASAQMQKVWEKRRATP